jgi:gamma-glutamyltranspeptidase/glutathione hydrolase
MHTSRLIPVAALAALAALTACGGGSSNSFNFTSLPITNAPPPPASPPAGPPGTDAPPAVRFDPALCTQQAGAPHGQTAGITGTNLMVTSAHYEASKAGCKILATGGSAIDAAIAVQAVLGTAEPFASGLGGGTLITYYDAASKKVRTFDGLSAAPSSTGGAADVYKAVAQDVSTTPPYNLCKSGLTLGASVSSQQGNTNISARAVGIPGTVAVLDLVHRSYGKKAWNTLWDDAIGLAENGFPMTRYMYATLYADSAEFDDDGNPVSAGTGVAAWVNSANTVRGAPRCKYPDIAKRYCDPADASRQKPLPIGTLITNPELAQTMKLVRDGGATAFYDPAQDTVKAIVQRTTADSLPCKSILPGTGTPGSPNTATTIASIPSLMAPADFPAYKAVERKPLAGTRFGTTIYTQPAPSFGGFVTLYSLGILERKHVQDEKALDTPRFVYLAAEASRLANVDRRAVVGDPAYSNSNARASVLLSDIELDKRAAQIGETAFATAPAGNIGSFVATDPAGYDTMATLAKPRKTMLAKAATAAAHDEDWNTTSNVAIVDGYGNALSMTTTINTHWGAHIEAAGIMLNNVMSNFSAGTALSGSEVNGYAGTKRPRTSIAPAIAFDGDGKLRLVWGSAGGGPIPDYIVKTFMGNVVYGLDLQAAVNAPNFTGQNGNAELEASSALAPLAGDMRTRFGYTTDNLLVTGLLSGISGIAVTQNPNGSATYSGAADNRRSGAANGY